MKKILCPECSKSLEFMTSYAENDKVVKIFHCDKCKNGSDSDWKVTYSKEKGVEKIERYYFG